MASSVTTEGFTGDPILDPLKHDGKSSNSQLDQSQEPEKGLETSPKAQDVSEQEEEYVTGIKLALVLGSLTVTYFLMMLDARRATLADLPTELICEILEHVLPEDIENFAGTCRTTASAVQRSLKIHRNLVRKYAISRNDALVEGSIGQLANEVAVDRIGRYIIWLECSGFRRPSLRQCDNEEHTLTDMLHFLPNLRVFTLDWPHGDLYKLEREIADAPHMAELILTRLEAVHLRCNGFDGYDGVQVDLVQAFCALPSMRQLSVTNLRTDQGIHARINPRSSNVIKLDLWNCKINLNNLHKYL